MAGIRIGGIAFIPSCSPPMTAYRGSGVGGGESAIYQSCVGDTPGGMTEIAFTDWADSDQNSNPRLSPDGTKIAFTVLGASSGYDELWVVDSAPGSTPVKLVDDPSNYIWHPGWIDNDTIVFVHLASGSFNGGGVYSVPATGGTPALLLAAAGGFTPRRPQGNFDGSRVAYIWDEDAGTAAELRVMDPDGTNDALVDTLADSYSFNDPPMFSWALASNLIAYSDGAIMATPRKCYMIDEDGTGKDQLATAGDAAGIAVNVSHLAWAPGDAFVVLSGDLALGDGIQPIRCEVDGSGDSTVLPVGTGFGPQNRNWFRGALIYNNRVWWIRRTNSVGVGEVQSCALDGSDARVDFLSTDGPGDLVEPFGGGDGWYWN